jgi:hypothetical protein
VRVDVAEVVAGVVDLVVALVPRDRDLAAVELALGVIDLRREVDVRDVRDRQAALEIDRRGQLVLDVLDHLEDAGRSDPRGHDDRAPAVDLSLLADRERGLAGLDAAELHGERHRFTGVEPEGRRRERRRDRGLHDRGRVVHARAGPAAARRRYQEDRRCETCCHDPSVDDPTSSGKGASVGS